MGGAAFEDPASGPFIYGPVHEHDGDDAEGDPGQRPLRRRDGFAPDYLD